MRLQTSLLALLGCFMWCGVIALISIILQATHK